MQQLILGTSRWGFEIDKDMARVIFDTYVETCHLQRIIPIIDSATNYPINRNIRDYKLANYWLHEFSNGVSGDQVGIINKLGSLNNAGTEENNLSATHLQLQLEESLSLFGDKLKGVGIHWDKRNVESEVRETLDWLASTSRDFKIDPWLSGIKSIGLYSKILEQTNLSLNVQVRETIHDRSQRIEYLKHKEFFHQKYFVYGINGGGSRNMSGCRSQQQENDMNMMHVMNDIETSGLIIGPRTNEQLESSLSTWFRAAEI